MDLPNPNPNFSLEEYYSFAGNSLDSSAQLQVSDYLVADECGFEQDSSSASLTSTEKVAGGSMDPSSGAVTASATSADSNMKFKSRLGKHKLEVGHRVAFRMKSDLEVIDDGYKWRKYGKKSVKNNPYPRNYYKCSVVGCFVKKRVEKDKDDAGYVITTYEGIHNHESPCDLYSNQMLSHTIQNSSPSSFYP